MTRKQALHKALESINDNEVRSKIEEILEDMPFTGWSERTIFDTIDQFILDNKRIPTTTDFKFRRLPPHTVIKLRFGVTLKEFLLKYYPIEKLNKSAIYYDRPREHWQIDFIKQYHNIKPYGAEQYNDARNINTPSWATVAKMFDITKWLNWLAYCEVIPYTNKRKLPRDKVLPQKINITSTITMLGENGHEISIAKNINGEISLQSD